MEILGATSIGIPRITDPILSREPATIEIAHIISDLKPRTAIIVTLDANSQRFLIDKDIVSIGRDGDADIVLNDYSVSRRHAEIIRTQERFTIQDVGSLNGTYVNAELHDTTTAIKDGDEIQIGRYRLKFFASKPAITECDCDKHD